MEEGWKERQETLTKLLEVQSVSYKHMKAPLSPAGGSGHPCAFSTALSSFQAQAPEQIVTLFEDEQHPVHMSLVEKGLADQDE